jgi:hypothetical protein
MKKWAHELNREFSKEQLQMANKYMKKCSTSLDLKEKQIKTMLIVHHTLVRTAIFKNKKTNNASEDGVKQELLYTAGGNAN